MLDNADKALENNDYEHAIDLYSEALKSSPQNALIYQGLGRAFYRSDKFDESQQNCETAMQLDPTLPVPYLLLAYLKFKKKEKINVCYQLAEKAYQLAPNLPEVITCLAWASLLVEKNEQAATLLEEALSMRPNEWQVRNNLYIAYTKLGKMDDAYTQAKEIYQLHPSFDTGIRLFISFMATKKVKAWSRILLFGSMIAAVLLQVASLLLIPAIYLGLLLFGGIYALSHGSKRSGITTIVVILFFYLLLFFILTFISKR